nr:MAG TPA: tail fiber protein [Caudoviricetes sp.]
MIAHVDNRITYNGNGNATEFAYQFKILDRTDIKVLLTDADGKEKLLTKDYYVDVEKNVVRYPGYAVGAEVPESERPAVLPTGWKLTIYREVPVTQETDLPDQYPFNQVEDIGDKLTMIAQQLTDVTGRSLKIGVSTSADIDTTIPWENGKSFRISDDGKTLELSEDPAKVLPLAQGVYAQTQAQAQSAAASATAAAKSEDSAFESAGVAGNSAQYASLSAASAAENAELTSGYKQEALTAKADATASATNAKASEANAKISENNAEASKEAAQSAATTASNFANASRSSANEARTYRDNAKNYSENVNVFTPSVSEDGILSWTNKAGLPNPPSVNIKGKDGADGGVTVDENLSATSTNPLQNRAVYDLSQSIFSRIKGVSDDIPTKVSVLENDAGYIKTVNNTKPDSNGNVTIAVSGGADITVDSTLSSTSTNPVQNKVINAALDNKLGIHDTALYARMDSAGYVIANTYVRSVNGVAPDSYGNVAITVSGGSGSGSDITVDTELSSTSTNPVQNKVIKGALDDKANLNKNNTFSKDNYFQKGISLIAYRDLDSAIKWYQSTANPPVASIDATNYTGNAASATKATQDSEGNVITETYAKKADVSDVVKSVNGTKPDTSGNVTIAVSGGGVSTSESNTWTAEQIFYYPVLLNEKYNTYTINGTSDTPLLSTMVYTVTGAFTLNLSSLADRLGVGQSSIFTAYFSANGDYPLTITNAGTIKYIGSASDVAISSTGMLLNILMTKDTNSNLTSIVQASKLS